MRVLIVQPFRVWMIACDVYWPTRFCFEVVNWPYAPFFMHGYLIFNKSIKYFAASIPSNQFLVGSPPQPHPELSCVIKTVKGFFHQSFQLSNTWLNHTFHPPPSKASATETKREAVLSQRILVTEIINTATNSDLPTPGLPETSEINLPGLPVNVNPILGILISPPLFVCFSCSMIRNIFFK